MYMLVYLLTKISIYIIRKLEIYIYILLKLKDYFYYDYYIIILLITIIIIKGVQRVDYGSKRSTRSVPTDDGCTVGCAMLSAIVLDKSENM